MELLYIILLAMSLKGDNSVSLGVGYDRSLVEGSNPRSLIRYTTERACGDVVCFGEYNHHSSFGEGWPMNDKPEDLTDQVSFGIKVRF